MAAEACRRLRIDRCDYRFSRRQVREYTGWSYDQVRVHLERLIELEYVLVHRGAGARALSMSCSMMARGRTAAPF